MRNVISIDSRYDCVCNAVVSTDTKTDEIVLEVITGDSANPCVKLIVNDESHYIKLKANQSNYVNITSESWTLGESIQFQYVNNEYEGTLFTLNFPAIVKDITVSQTGETEFTVKSTVVSTQALTTEDIVNNLTSTDTHKVLGADQGKVLNDKIGGVESTVTALNKDVTALSEDVRELSTGLTDVNKVVTGLNTSVAELSTEMSDINGTVTNLSGSVTDIYRQLDNNKVSKFIGYSGGKTFNITVNNATSVYILFVRVSGSVGTFLIEPNLNSVGTYYVTQLSSNGSFEVTASGTTISVNCLNNSGSITYRYIEF